MKKVTSLVVFLMFATVAEAKLAGFYCSATAWRFYLDPGAAIQKKSNTPPGKSLLGDGDSIVIVEASNEDLDNGGRGKFIKLRSYDIDPDELKYRHGDGRVTFNGQLEIQINVVEDIQNQSVIFTFDVVNADSDHHAKRILSRSETAGSNSTASDAKEITADLSNLDVVNAELESGMNGTPHENDLIKSLLKSKKLADGSFRGIIVKCMPAESERSAK